MGVFFRSIFAKYLMIRLDICLDIQRIIVEASNPISELPLPRGRQQVHKTRLAFEIWVKTLTRPNLLNTYQLPWAFLETGLNF